MADYEGFNPRAREGRDGVLRGGKPAPEVSIHAPARGATRREAEIQFPPIVSIHAPARGATNVGLLFPFSISGFNPRAREGRD